MNETGPQNEKQRIKERIFSLATELSESVESFTFPGIEPVSYQRLKEDREIAQIYAPDATTDVDELIGKFEKEGMKVVLGKDRNAGNVFILPTNTAEIGKDDLFPRHLQTNETMDTRLKELIELDVLLRKM